LLFQGLSSSRGYRWYQGVLEGEFLV